MKQLFYRTWAINSTKVLIAKTMSLNPSYTSPFSTTISSSSLIDSREDVVNRKPLIGLETSALVPGLLPHDDGKSKTNSSCSKLRNKESSGKAFLSVRNNVGLLKSHSLEGKTRVSSN